MKKILKLIYGIILTFYYSKNKKNKEVFLCNRGMGDTLYFCTYLKAYKEQFNRRIVLIAAENHKFIIELYREFIDEVIYVSELQCNAMCKAFAHDMVMKNMRFVFPKDAMLYLGYKGIRINDLPKIQLKLPESTSMYFPKVELNQESINFLLEKYQLFNKKLILISPNAVTIKKINKDLWHHIVKYYTERHYIVLTNLKNQGEKAIEGTIGICEDIGLIFELSKYVEKFIGLRSGLCDLLAFSTCDMQIIYPNDVCETNKLKNKFSLCELGFNKEIVEITEDKVIEMYGI